MDGSLNGAVKICACGEIISGWDANASGESVVVVRSVRSRPSRAPAQSYVYTQRLRFGRLITPVDRRTQPRAEYNNSRPPSVKMGRTSRCASDDAVARGGCARAATSTGGVGEAGHSSSSLDCKQRHRAARLIFPCYKRALDECERMMCENVHVNVSKVRVCRHAAFAPSTDARPLFSIDITISIAWTTMARYALMLKSLKCLRLRRGDSIENDK